MFNYITWMITGIALIISFRKDNKKTILALKKAWGIFEKMLPQFIAILLFVGIMLTLLGPTVIRQSIGAQSGLYGMLIASFIGSITIIPVFIVFPIASALLRDGAGIMQISVFIFTLISVGLVTIPLECKYFGIKISVLRNIFAYIFSFVIAFIVGMTLS